MQLPSSNASPRARRLLVLVLCSWLITACGPPAWRGGIHAQLAWSPHGVRVVEVPEEGPARRADLRPDDRIVAVDGVALAGRDSDAVQRLLSGEVGSRATIQVLRDGELLTLQVEREPYARKGVER